MNDAVIHVLNYIWYGHNRKNLHVNAPKGSGGVGFLVHNTVRTKGYSTDLLDPTQVESKKCSQIQWPVPSINAEPVDIFLGEE